MFFLSPLPKPHSKGLHGELYHPFSDRAAPLSLQILLLKPAVSLEEEGSSPTKSSDASLITA